MNECFSELGSDIHAEPRICGFIFAINRGIRFSMDKTLYKIYLELWFIGRPARWQAFVEALEHGIRKGVYTRAERQNFRGKAKEIPRLLGTGSVAPAYPRADWVPRSGLFTSVARARLAEVFTDRLAGVCFEHDQRAVPLQQWLGD